MTHKRITAQLNRDFDYLKGKSPAIYHIDEAQLKAHQIRVHREVQALRGTRKMERTK